jgi:hypothetical protein
MARGFADDGAGQELPIAHCFMRTIDSITCSASS